MGRQIVSAWIPLTCAFAAANAVAQDTTQPANEEHRVIVSKLSEQVVSRCSILIGPDQQALALHPQSLLSWSNPTVGEVHGEIFVWTHHGRPQCLASVYRWFSPDWGTTLELAALTAAPLRGRDREREFWRVSEANIPWQTSSKTDVPSGSPTGRLVQLRQIARLFSARLYDTRLSEQAVSRQLRLMAQPLFRYSPPTADSSYADGALFAFVEGTDPELLLLVECSLRENAGVWKYAFLRMNSNRMEVTEGERQVWSAENLEFADILNSPTAPYTLLTIDAASGSVKP